MYKTSFNNRIEYNNFLQMLYNINGKDRVKVCSSTKHNNGTIELCYSILPKAHKDFIKSYNAIHNTDFI